MCSVIHPYAALVFTEGHIDRPMRAVLDGQVRTHGIRDVRSIRLCGSFGYACTLVGRLAVMVPRGRAGRVAATRGVPALRRRALCAAGRAARAGCRAGEFGAGRRARRTARADAGRAVGATRGDALSRVVPARSRTAAAGQAVPRLARRRTRTDARGNRANDATRFTHASRVKHRSVAPLSALGRCPANERSRRRRRSNPHSPARAPSTEPHAINRRQMRGNQPPVFAAVIGRP